MKRPRIIDERPVRICILNTQLDTGNLGLQALGITTLCELAARLPHAHMTILSSWPGRRCERVVVHQPWGEQRVEFEELGCSLSRNPWKSGNLYVEALLRRARFGDAAGIITRCMADADLILDCSGGDSFTTLYGDWRYRYITYPKHVAREHRAPMVLLPQTYGPFDDSVAADVQQIMQACDRVWARDTRSLLLAERHGARDARICPDIAFRLPTSPPPKPTGPRTIGINVSGLLWGMDDDTLAARYCITCNYAKLMIAVVVAMLRESSLRVTLVPHVIADGNAAESDVRAAHELRLALDPEDRARVRVLRAPDDAMHAKASIASCEFFVGTRMHACIAALSSGVPTCAIAYSDKTAGVFETVGCADMVFDPRHRTHEAIIAGLVCAWRNRPQRTARLNGEVAGAQCRIAEMFDELAELAVKSTRTSPELLAA